MCSLKTISWALDSIADQLMHCRIRWRRACTPKSKLKKNRQKKRGLNSGTYRSAVAFGKDESAVFPPLLFRCSLRASQHGVLQPVLQSMMRTAGEEKEREAKTREENKRSKQHFLVHLLCNAFQAIVLGNCCTFFQLRQFPTEVLSMCANFNFRKFQTSVESRVL
jgi:hypothetical protein